MIATTSDTLAIGTRLYQDLFKSSLGSEPIVQKKNAVRSVSIAVDEAIKTKASWVLCF